MAAPKTQRTVADVGAFLDGLADERRRREGQALRDLFERATGAPAQMWGPTMVGFGSHTPTGSAEWFVVGFSARAAAQSLYGIYDADAPDPLLAQLGPHTTGKGCLYIKRLDAVDDAVLESLVAAAWVRQAGAA